MVDRSDKQDTSQKADTIEVTGHIDVVPVDLPADMAEAERERARAHKVGDILMFLERHQSQIDKTLAETVSHRLPDGMSGDTTMVVETEAPIFRVSIAAKMDDGVEFDRRALASDLSGAIEEAVTGFIGAQATKVGHWRPSVRTDLGSATGHQIEPTGQPGTVVPKRNLAWLLVASVFCGVLIAAFVFYQ
ncbi:MAG: hypothetical protein ACR2PA_03510 [Hyphomicrobiaceae bacterium]